MPKATGIMKFIMKTANTYPLRKTELIWVSFQIANQR